MTICSIKWVWLIWQNKSISFSLEILRNIRVFFCASKYPDHALLRGPHLCNKLASWLLYHFSPADETNWCWVTCFMTFSCLVSKAINVISLGHMDIIGHHFCGLCLVIQMSCEVNSTDYDGFLHCRCWQLNKIPIRHYINKFRSLLLSILSNSNVKGTVEAGWITSTDHHGRVTMDTFLHTVCVLCSGAKSVTCQHYSCSQRKIYLWIGLINMSNSIHQQYSISAQYRLCVHLDFIIIEQSVCFNIYQVM